MKKKQFFLTMLVCLLAFGLLHISCSMENNNNDMIAKADYYGIWKNSNNAVRNISATTMIVDVGVWAITFKLDSVTPSVNNNKKTKADYPNGFIFSGQIVTKTGTGFPDDMGNLGDIYTQILYMHNNKKSFAHAGINIEDIAAIYYKQP